MKRYILLILAVQTGMLSPQILSAAEKHEFFETRIRPVLVEHCYECHSAGSDQIQGGLRLDFRQGLLDGGDSGPAVVPGQPTESLLVSALRHQDFKMPPAGKLPEQVITDFEHWIQSGADDPRDAAPSADDAAQQAWQARLAERSRWWSLQPPQFTPPPEVPEAGLWAAEPVDRFLAAKLRAAGLRPAVPADPETLLRRLCFVLTGLPPVPQQVVSFRAAYEREPEAALLTMVDELLASPHYGERLARHWMDVVRYTDTYGYEWDNPAKGSWEYRDYLIRAFNGDVGFDQLIREQVAGDLLPEPRINEAAGVNESLIGPMFYHMGEHRHGSSLDFNGIHQEMIDNKIDAFSKAFLGMTVACARCHDHKLDAVSQADYYALAGVIMTPRWTPRAIDASQARSGKIAELKRLRDEIRQALAREWLQRGSTVQSGTALQTWAVSHSAQLLNARREDVAFPLRQLLEHSLWSPAHVTAAVAEAAGTKLVIGADGAILATGDVPAIDKYTVSLQTNAGTITQLRLETLTHETLVNGPGRAPHGNFVLSSLKVEVRPLTNDSTPPGDWQEVRLATATADFSQAGYPVDAVLKPATGQGWAVDQMGKVGRTATFGFAEPVNLPHGGEWRIVLDQSYGIQHVIGRFRLSLGQNLATPTEIANSAPLESAWTGWANAWRGHRQARMKSNSERFQTLTDFREPGFPDTWTVDGEGLEHGYVTAGTPLVSLEGEQLIARLLPQGYHTHALSSKLAGAIHLPAPETYARQFLSLKLSGGEWAGWQQVPQNAFLTEGPVFLDPAAPAAWMTFGPVGLRNGVTRVLTDIATASLHPNFPPRTGVARMGNTVLPDKDESLNKRSWFSLTGIVAHQEGGLPAEELAPFVALYEAPESITPQTVQAGWEQLAAWYQGALTRWSNGAVQDGDVPIINWLLQEQLLPNTPASLPALAPLITEYRELEATLTFSRSVNSLDERGLQPVNYRLNVRGNVDDEGPAVPKGFLEVFADSQSVRTATTSGRLELADYLSSSRNPVTARVYVNRVWMWVFGTAIAATPNDFGKLGDVPTHPELLDWLALKFMEEGWSTRKLIRRLVLSQAFRQSGIVSPEALEKDPDNWLWHHYPTRRLEGEAIRDSLLKVSGRLDPALFGPPLNPPRAVEDTSKRLFSGPLDGLGRRSIYTELSIMEPPKFLTGFNLPDLKLPTGKRDVTNVPAQALIMLNNPLVTQLAEHWARQIVQDGRSDPRDRVRAMFLAALGRSPTEIEVQRWTTAVESFSTSPERVLDDIPAWTELAHALFNTKEFIYYR